MPVVAILSLRMRIIFDHVHTMSISRTRVRTPRVCTFIYYINDIIPVVHIRSVCHMVLLERLDLGVNEIESLVSHINPLTSRINPFVPHRLV